MDRVIVITGGGGKLGEILTRHLSKNNIVISLSHKDCDITSRKVVSKVFKSIIKKHKRIDVLINAAGVMIFNPLKKISDKEIDLTLNVNFKGVVNTIQEIIPIMERQEYGRIINLSSIRGITGAPNKAVYSASKFALQGFIDSLRYELKGSNIKVTNICPGRILETVSCRDIVSSVNYVLSLSDRTFVRNIILGGQL